MDAPGPRYRDREESRFYQAGGLSPEQTWHALGDELSRVLNDAQRAFWRGPLQVDPERIRWWHGAIFARHFPHDGGRFRRDRAFFGVVIPNGEMRQLEGAAPEAIRRELQTVCSLFNRYADALGDPDTTAVLERTRAVAALYAGILRCTRSRTAPPRELRRALRGSLVIRAAQRRVRGQCGHDRSRRRARSRSGIQEWEHRALRAASSRPHPALDRVPDMSYAERMDGSFPKLDRPHTVRKGRLVEATPEVNREVAESAMLLSQGAHRAIEMKQEARQAASCRHAWHSQPSCLTTADSDISRPRPPAPPSPHGLRTAKFRPLVAARAICWRRTTGRSYRRSVRRRYRAYCRRQRRRCPVRRSSSDRLGGSSL